MKKFAKYLIVALLTVIPTAVGAADIYVSPTAGGNGDGSFGRPYKTLEQAKDAVRAINSEMSEDITVYLRGGTYNLSQTLNFSEADSGKNGHKVHGKPTIMKNP